ncbi:MAG TPA: DUF2254 domain-containing protein [Polyangiaceae bacterium]|nr:DUF2254 domain-containing protein [Polyangiaceae bacterium]
MMPTMAPAGHLETVTAAVYVVVALFLGFAVPLLHHGVWAWANPDLQRDQVTTFLSSVSSGMMAFTGIVFSLLFLMLQFSTTAYSPHLLPMLARNRTLAHAGGVFTGTFLYSLMALRGVGAVQGGGTPAVVLWVGFGWLLASVYLLLRLVRVFSGLAITDVLEMIGDLGWSQLDRVYSPYAGPVEAVARRLGRGAPAAGTETQVLRHAGKPRYVVGLDLPRLVELAVASDTFIRVPLALGDAVTSGVPLAMVHEAGVRVPEKALRAAIMLDRDRTLEQGPKQAIRLLVDIAIRALSLAVNDPTTAVHALDQIEAILLRIGNSDLDVGMLFDAREIPRVSYVAPSWEDYLDLALTEIRQYGAGAVQIERRLCALLTHLRDQVPDERRPAIDRIAADQSATLRGAIADASLRRQAEHVDRQGLGHTNGGEAPWPIEGDDPSALERTTRSGLGP